jgi:hypothetical protein
VCSPMAPKTSCNLFTTGIRASIGAIAQYSLRNLWQSLQISTEELCRSQANCAQAKLGNGQRMHLNFLRKKKSARAHTMPVCQATSHHEDLTTSLQSVFIHLARFDPQYRLTTYNADKQHLHSLQIAAADSHSARHDNWHV